MRYYECPECGTEILEAEDCVYCEGGTNLPHHEETGEKTECVSCNGTGKSNDYYCPHCDWSHEE